MVVVVLDALRSCVQRREADACLRYAEGEGNSARPPGSRAPASARSARAVDRVSTSVRIQRWLERNPRCPPTGAAVFHGGGGEQAARTLHPRPPPAGAAGLGGGEGWASRCGSVLGDRHATAAWSDVALAAGGSLRKRPRSFGVNGCNL